MYCILKIVLIDNTEKALDLDMDKIKTIIYKREERETGRAVY